MSRRKITSRTWGGALLLALIFAMGLRSAQSQSAEWKPTSVVEAPEAVQGAAADERFLYAIANGQVAKYDRQTGERVATSRGKAQHLNSGVFWQGKLYCAHSNYPQTPELSELKVLDPESMQVTTHKDFGDFGGSLTWAIRHDEHWWCNFARYGDNNHETFLAKFDDRWRELARWTYPDSVVSELKRYSLSGGIFRGGELLVTGHDDPVLFRLRVPARGKVLKLVGRERVPFTGQGIAYDPVTGGLVGIDRGKRQLVLASRSEEGQGPLTIRVLTYNIHHGEGVDGKLDLQRIAGVIRSVDPDLVALQEVDQRVERTNGIDQPAELARLTGMHVAFGGNIKLQGGDYGNAVLSRWAIEATTNHLLPCLDGGEQRGVLEVKVALPGVRSPLHFLATHLDHRPDGKERLSSAKKINSLGAREAESPAILAGDLNDVLDSAALVELRKSWHTTNDKPLPTIPVSRPLRQIDFVLVRPAARWRVVETRVLEEAVASDHRAVLAVIEWLPSKAIEP
jgi:endonuclease/exonuclease/phosphatase family metal-dependent hydrolase